MADLQEVNQTLKEQNELLKGNRALEVENKREADRKQNELMKLLSGLKATVNINGKPADIWAIGVTMYYCSTGTYPFEGKSAAEL